MGEAAVRAAQAANYATPGTVEFLLDSARALLLHRDERADAGRAPGHRDAHRVDIVREQIRIAAGQKLRLRAGRIWFNGHAIECRILAADGERGFMPSPGTITRWDFPSGPGVQS
jgi:acetyl-CoA carboxylase biotin carboxylase subunit